MCNKGLKVPCNEEALGRLLAVSGLSFGSMVWQKKHNMGTESGFSTFGIRFFVRAAPRAALVCVAIRPSIDLGEETAAAHLAINHP
jgi:hypothetical protein